MDLERRRDSRAAVEEDGSNGVVRASVAVALRDISASGLRLSLCSWLDPGGVYPFTALLRGLSLATPIRITRCQPDGLAPPPEDDRALAWEAGAEFLWRDDGDATTVRRWLESRALRQT